MLDGNRTHYRLDYVLSLRFTDTFYTCLLEQFYSYRCHVSWNTSIFHRHIIPSHTCLGAAL